MADILIRGIDFPQCCGECPFQASRWTGDFCSAGQLMLGIDFDYRQKHPKCPIDPIPEGHGKIVDAEEIRTRLIRKLTACKPGTIEELTFAVSIDIVDHAHTIVPAEGGGEE